MKRPPHRPQVPRYDGPIGIMISISFTIQVYNVLNAAIVSGSRAYSTKLRLPPLLPQKHRSPGLPEGAALVSVFGSRSWRIGPDHRWPIDDQDFSTPVSHGKEPSAISGQGGDIHLAKTHLHHGRPSLFALRAGQVE